MRVQSLLGKIPWSRQWQPASVFLPKKFHGQQSLAGYSPWGHKESDTTEWLNMHTHAGMWTQEAWVMLLIIIPIFQMRKLRLRNLSNFPQPGRGRTKFQILILHHKVNAWNPRILEVTHWKGWRDPPGGSGQKAMVSLNAPAEERHLI